MLSSTADKLFWLARYAERADNLARMLDVTHRMSLFPQSQKTSNSGWTALLAISDLLGEYKKHYSEVTAANTLAFFLFDKSHPSSIISCWHAMRENARAVRGALSAEAWETINSTWIELRDMEASLAVGGDVGSFFEWVKYRSHLVRGVLRATMLRDEAFHFWRLGTYLERADSTARILDVKYNVLLPKGEGVGSAVDYYQWSSVLRSLAAFEVYRKVYRDAITPRRVAELLILRADMPRSLGHCVQECFNHLQQVRNLNSSETERRVGILDADLRYGRIDDIFNTGLHEYLMSFIDRIHEIGEGVTRDFLIHAEVA
ncbi:MAG: alpha-E domain-containing protein [Steroidobacteraceae bacterium]